MAASPGDAVARRQQPNDPARPSGEARRSHSVAELWADGVVHACGLLLAASGSILMLVCPPKGSGADVGAVGVYLASLTLSIAASAAYNVWPVSRPKRILRRLDHSAIYLLIAGTYAPFIVRLGIWWFLSAIWAIAILGIALKLFRPGRFDRLSIVVYLMLGWSGIVVFDKLLAAFPPVVPWLIAAGGLTYSVGVVFHLWERMRFQNAVWHAFVLIAAILHYCAIWSAVHATA